MWVARYLTIAVFAALALQTSLPAQECNSSRAGFHLGWPYTAEYREENGTLDGEGRPGPTNKDTVVVAEDSHGRFLYHWTSTNTDRGSNSRVYDPVAAQEISWDSNSTKAKIVKYATPLAGRRSCWQRSWSEPSAINKRTSRNTYKAFCAPAGQNQPWGCHDVCEAERQAKALPPEKIGFPKCDSAPGGTAEDLGMSEIQGMAAHGCRRTTPFPKEGNIVIENWSDEYGLTLREIQEHSTGVKLSKELIHLSRDEPDLSVFQPPKGFEVVTLEMEEVPCE